MGLLHSFFLFLLFLLFVPLFTTSIRIHVQNSYLDPRFTFIPVEIFEFQQGGKLSFEVIDDSERAEFFVCNSSSTKKWRQQQKEKDKFCHMSCLISSQKKVQNFTIPTSDIYTIGFISCISQPYLELNTKIEAKFEFLNPNNGLSLSEVPLLTLYPVCVWLWLLLLVVVVVGGGVYWRRGEEEFGGGGERRRKRNFYLFFITIICLKIQTLILSTTNINNINNNGYRDSPLHYLNNISYILFQTSLLFFFAFVSFGWGLCPSPPLDDLYPLLFIIFPFSVPLAYFFHSLYIPLVILYIVFVPYDFTLILGKVWEFGKRKSKLEERDINFEENKILNHALKSLTTKYSTSLYLLLSFSFYYPSLFLSIFSSHFLPYTLATLPTLFLQLTDFIYFIIFIFILNPFRVGNELFWFPSGCEKEENHTNSSSSLSSSPEWLEELFLFREELMKPETVDYY